MGFFGRKRDQPDQQQQVSDALERLSHRAEGAMSGHLGATVGLGALKDVMALANEARAEAGPMREYSMRLAHLAAQGIDATATVRSVEPTTIAALMGGEQVHVELTVQPPNGAAYEASADQVLMPGQQNDLTAGSEVHVKVDPDDPQSVMVMLAGSGIGPAVFQSPGVTVISSGGAAMASAAPPPPAPAPTDTVSQLEALAKLHSSGELTDAEFADAKRRLLNT